MDFSHVEILEVSENIQKCIVNDHQKMLLDDEGHVKSTKPIFLETFVTNMCSNNFISVYTATDGVYTVGNDALRQGLLGVSHKSYSKTPLKLDLEGSYMECSISTTHAAVIKQDGSLIVWGNLAHMNFQTRKPILISNTQLFIPTQVLCGKNFTAINTVGGSVYLFKSPTSGFEALAATKEFFIRNITGNDNFLACLTDSGNVFVWDSSGITKKLEVSSEISIKSIACSWKGILAICDDSKTAIVWTYCKNSKFKEKIVEIGGKIKAFSGWKICIVKSVENSLLKIKENDGEGYFMCRGCRKEVRFEKGHGKHHSDKCLRCLKSEKRVKNVIKNSKNVEKINRAVMVVMKNVKFGMGKVQMFSVQKVAIDRSIAFAKMFSMFYRIDMKITKVLMQKYFWRMKIKKNHSKEFFEIISSVFKAKKFSYFEEFFNEIKRHKEQIEYLIYTLNSFTLVITKIRFRLKYEVLEMLQSNTQVESFLKIMQSLFLEKIYKYFTVIKYCYFEGCISNLIKNIIRATARRAWQCKFFVFTAFSNLPSKPKRNYISLDRLLTNQKLKKDKVINALKDSMSSPKVFNKKKIMFCVKSVNSLLDTKKVACSTERRLEYSMRLNQKIQKIQEKRKSFDFNEKFFRRFDTNDIFQLQKSLCRPISRVFAEIFYEKKKHRFKSFSILTKVPPVSPKYFLLK